MLNPFLLLISLIITSLFCIYILTKWMIFNKPCSKRILLLPPSPPKIPILGNLHQLSSLAHRSFQSLGRKYGPVMLLHFGSRPVIIIQSADAAMEVMKTHDVAFASKPLRNLTKRLFYDEKDIIFSPYGELWRKLKSICVLHLLSSKRVESFKFIREEETTLLMEKIKSCCHSSLNLSEMFMSLSNDLICRSAFGRKYSEGEGGKKLLMLITELQNLLGSTTIGELVPCLSWINYINGFDARVDRVVRDIDDFLNEVIQKHQNAEDLLASTDDDDTVKVETISVTFVDILLKIYKDNIGVSIDKDNIKGIILDMYAAATDTTAATLVWVMTELLRYPIVMNKLQKEIREIVRDKHVDIADGDLEKMHYLKAVVKETLRYHTPAPILAREAREDVKVMGYEVAAGTMMIINAWAIGRDPASWDEPEKFKPERFLINSSLNYGGQDFEFIPFGSGRRGCPGITFAMKNIELVLSNLLRNFDWELPQDGTKTVDLDTIEHPGSVLLKKNPLYAVATPHCYF